LALKLELPSQAAVEAAVQGAVEAAVDAAVEAAVLKLPRHPNFPRPFRLGWGC